MSAHGNQNPLVGVYEFKNIGGDSVEIASN